MKARYTSSEWSDSPTLGQIEEAVREMRDAGAPIEAEIILTMGDKGSQRDPWPYLRAFTARWEV